MFAATFLGFADVDEGTCSGESLDVTYVGSPFRFDSGDDWSRAEDGEVDADCYDLDSALASAETGKMDGGDDATTGPLQCSPASLFETVRVRVRYSSPGICNDSGESSASCGGEEQQHQDEEEQPQEETEGQEDAHSGDGVSSSTTNTERGDDNTDALGEVAGDAISREGDDGGGINATSPIGPCYGDAESQLPSLLRRYLRLSRRSDRADPSQYSSFEQAPPGDGANAHQPRQRQEEGANLPASFLHRLSKAQTNQQATSSSLTKDFDDGVDYLTDDDENASLATQEAEGTGKQPQYNMRKLLLFAFSFSSNHCLEKNTTVISKADRELITARK